MARKAQDPMTLFFSHVMRGKDNECWMWTGSVRSGYGSGWLNGRKQGAHCVSYQLFIGDIPQGLEVMHSCNNPLCVNPDHLSIGTHAENMAQTAVRRKSMSPARGTRHGLAKLDEHKVVAIWDLRKSGLTRSEIGDMFGVTGVTITYILTRKTWTHVTQYLSD